MNFKSIRGRTIGTIINGHKTVIGKLEQVKLDQKEKSYRFVFENGYVFMVQQRAFFYHTILQYENDCVLLVFSQERIFSGMMAYTLYETCGLPLEFVVGEMGRKGIPVDEQGFHIMEELQRNRNKNTFKNKNAFN